MLIEAPQILKLAACAFGPRDLDQLALFAKAPSFEAINAKEQWAP